ncbi:MAG: BtaA family protein [Rhodanobacteraceae bacterium]|nr:BtaA family protein [Rhodanobacteraceae bacterium]
MSSLKQRAYDAWFRHVHGSRLIYNTCWEDPRADRALLGVGRGARIAMITSAGCNALDYLLDDPAEIHCVDLNPRQNALLDLKLAALVALDHGDLFALFGEGAHSDFAEIYRHALRRRLAPESAAFWDRHQHWFDGRGRGSFYFRGAAGDVAWWVRAWLKALRPRLRRELLELFESPDLAIQRERWARIEPRLFGPLLRLVVRQPATLSLLGVPRAQRDLIAQQYPGGVSAFVQDKLRWLMTEVPASENYFWRLYLHGSYTRQCCPNYLRQEHLATLRERAWRVRLHTRGFADFLAAHEDRLTHFVLLDHQDWLWAHDQAALEQEWRMILARSAPGARVLLRSAALAVDFLPAFARQSLHPQVDSERWHQRDRVGTYGSMLLAEVAA